MFNQLGAIDVGHQNRRHEWFVDLLHQVDGVFALRANHDTIRVHQVGYSAVFAQEFGIADNVKFRAMPVIAFDRFTNLFAGFDGHRALVHDYPVARQDSGDLTRNFFNKAEVDATVWLLWRRHSDEDNLRILDPVLNATSEPEPVGRNISMNDFFQSGFVDGNPACLEGRYFLQ